MDSKHQIKSHGCSAKENLLFTEVTEGLNSYGATQHRHVKGALDQALQNLNLLMGFPENLGLHYLPLFP
ncbi:hypothetical protein JHK82_024929 [Glycine max]|nr:hypothetical protein JHK85_025541 [Glycine max]KAG5012789.1 hypothetical protein JHK86_025050 [Glycine max]KAG5133741.1 hypothetical protein JHK82_024929 [Glycine max]